LISASASCGRRSFSYRSDCIRTWSRTRLAISSSVACGLRPSGERTVLVALTGFGQSEDRLRTREAGFDHHLVKPVDPTAVLQLVTASVLEG